MKRILVWFFILSFSLATARAQDDATQQQINKLNGQFQDLLDAQAVQAKRITALEKEISELESREKELTAELEKPKTYATGGGAAQINRELMQVHDRLTGANAEWEKAGTELAEFEAEAAAT